MKQVLVIGYPNDWHWVLTLEYANTQKSSELEVWDISWLGERGFKSFLKMLIGGNRFQKNCKMWLKSKQIPVKKIALYPLPISEVRDAYRSLVSKYSLIDARIHTAIFNTLVENLGTLRVDPKKHKKEIMRELKSSMVVRNYLESADPEAETQIVTVNGRFTKNSTIKEWADSKKLKRLLLEFGSTNEKFEIFQESPHSVAELSAKMSIAWKSASFPGREKIALEYLNALQANKVSSIHWREKIRESYIPKHPENKKICVFFASTEVEHAGVGDVIEEPSFRSQDEAFSGLVQTLPSDEWHLYIRRHPRNPDAPFKDDPESQLWEKFKNFSNVTVIEPDSPIDSIALGMSADLVTNYWSTIAIELILAGHPSVITLGSAPWNSMIPEYATTDVSKIKTFINCAPGLLNLSQIYPWAYFQATFGKEFQVFELNQQSGGWRFRELAP